MLAVGHGSDERHAVGEDRCHDWLVLGSES
jgi:hypothetical protein